MTAAIPTSAPYDDTGSKQVKLGSRAVLFPAVRSCRDICRGDNDIVTACHMSAVHPIDNSQVITVC